MALFADDKAVLLTVHLIGKVERMMPNLWRVDNVDAVI